ncbi:MAG: hypothetical protein ACO4CZ_04135, partial [Planctomycetota bacterium]
MEGWATACGAISRGRENQPALVAAFTAHVGNRCAYASSARGATADKTTWRPLGKSGPGHEKSTTTTRRTGSPRGDPLDAADLELVVLNQDLFVSGRPAAYARTADAES